MARVHKEIEDEQMNGLLMTMNDIDICLNAEGRKCRLGEGGFGVVYKALMNGVDEVAVKLVKVSTLYRRCLVTSRKHICFIYQDITVFRLLF